MAVASSPCAKTGSPFRKSRMVRPAPTLAKKSMGAKFPFVNFVADAFCLNAGRFAALAGLAATTSTVLRARVALPGRYLIGGCTDSRLLLSGVQKCAVLSTLQDLCVLSDRWPKIRNCLIFMEIRDAAVHFGTDIQSCWTHTGP